jgi:hypothetical protein
MDDSVFSNFSAVEFVLAAVVAAAVSVPVEGSPSRLDPAVLGERGAAGAVAGVRLVAGAVAGVTTGGSDMRGAAFDEDDPARTSPGGSGLVCDWAIVKLTMSTHAVPIDRRYFLSVMGVVLFLK